MVSLCNMQQYVIYNYMFRPCKWAIVMYSLPNIVRVVKIEKNEMSGACGAYGGGERYTQGSGWKPEGKNRWGDPDVDGRIILRWIFRK